MQSHQSQYLSQRCDITKQQKSLRKLTKMYSYRFPMPKHLETQHGECMPFAFNNSSEEDHLA